MKKLNKIAEANNLEIIDITCGINGYPKNTYEAIDASNLKTFEEIHKLAEEHKLDICVFHRRDGWHFWEDRGIAYEPFEITAEGYGDNYQSISKMDEATFIDYEVMTLIEGATTFGEIDTILKNRKEIWEEVEQMKDEEIVMLFEGNYYDTIQKNPLSFSEDTHNWIIGLKESD